MRHIRVQPRDLALLRDLGTVLVLDAQSIRRRHFADDRSGKALERRLRLLEGSDLIRSVPITAVFGRLHLRQRVYRLTVQGAALLAYHTEMDVVRLPHSDPKAETLLHRLGVARTMLALSDACQLHSLPAPRWIMEHDTVPGVSHSASKIPLSERYLLYEDFPLPGDRMLRCRPDAASLLRLPSAASEEHVLLAGYWEYDRSTERLVQFLRQKLPAYRALVLTKRYCSHWDADTSSLPAVRVFGVFQSEERLQNVSAAIMSDPCVVLPPRDRRPFTDREREEASTFIEDTFRFAVASAVEDKHRVLTDSIWSSPRDAAGIRRRPIFKAPDPGRTEAESLPISK